MNTFPKIKEVHLTDYLPGIITKFGHAILHGDGNIYIDKTFDAKGEPIEPKHQKSYLAKTYAASGNEVATYTFKFTNVDQIPDTLDKLEKMLLSSKARETVEDGKVTTYDDFVSIPVAKKAESEPKQNNFNNKKRV
jgi:hypothetical protein